MRLTLAEAAQRLGKTDRQVRYMVEQGTLKAAKKGGRWLVQSDSTQGVAPGSFRLTLRAKCRPRLLTHGIHLDPRRPEGPK